jgi:hypothetical protein
MDNFKAVIGAFKFFLIAFIIYDKDMLKVWELGSYLFYARE